MSALPQQKQKTGTLGNRLWTQAGRIIKYQQANSVSKTGDGYPAQGQIPNQNPGFKNTRSNAWKRQIYTEGRTEEKNQSRADDREGERENKVRRKI